jgi:hypothetical protein
MYVYVYVVVADQSSFMYVAVNNSLLSFTVIS